MRSPSPNVEHLSLSQKAAKIIDACTPAKLNQKGNCLKAFRNFICRLTFGYPPLYSFFIDIHACFFCDETPAQCGFHLLCHFDHYYRYILVIPRVFVVMTMTYVNLNKLNIQFFFIIEKLTKSQLSQCRKISHSQT